MQEERPVEPWAQWIPRLRDGTMTQAVLTPVPTDGQNAFGPEWSPSAGTSPSQPTLSSEQCFSPEVSLSLLGAGGVCVCVWIWQCLETQVLLASRRKAGVLQKKLTVHRTGTTTKTNPAPNSNGTEVKANTHYFPVPKHLHL